MSSCPGMSRGLCRDSRREEDVGKADIHHRQLLPPPSWYHRCAEPLLQSETETPSLHHWLAAMKRKTPPVNKSERVCSDHFVDNDCGEKTFLIRKESWYLEEKDFVYMQMYNMQIEDAYCYLLASYRFVCKKKKCIYYSPLVFVFLQWPWLSTSRCGCFRHAPPTLQPKQRLAASMIGVRNMAHSDSMSPASPETWMKLSRKWALKLLLTGDSARHSQQTLTICLGLPGLTGILPHHRSQLATRWWSVENSAPLFTRVSRTCGRKSDDTTTKSFIERRTRVSWC